MGRMASQETITAYNKAGYREKYVMDNGNRRTIYINGNKCYKYTYSKDKEYQDANGAIYDTIRECWIG